jgi:hypothetical protein
LLTQISEEIREKKNLQAALLQRYQETAAEIGKRPEIASAFAALLRPIQWLRSYLLVPMYGVPAASTNLYVRAVDLAESISDLQYAIQMEDFFKSWFARWLRLHIALSAVLFILLGLHIWAELHFGIRWFKA